jgi:hypothetical protein
MTLEKIKVKLSYVSSGLPWQPKPSDAAKTVRTRNFDVHTNIDNLLESSNANRNEPIGASFDRQNSAQANPTLS